jgi:uncharacterized protein (DUF2249 family)
METTTIDVRTMVPRERHPRIFETFDRLAPGEALRLVNDHDPKPLYYQFQIERQGQVDWEYLEQGPQVWQVRIRKTAPAAQPSPAEQFAAREPPALVGQAALDDPEDVVTTPIGTLVERYPGVEAVLEDFGFDTCCTVEFTPLEIAEKAAIEPGPLVAALRQVTEP